METLNQFIAAFSTAWQQAELASAQREHLHQKTPRPLQVRAQPAQGLAQTVQKAHAGTPVRARPMNSLKKRRFLTSATSSKSGQGLCWPQAW